MNVALLLLIAASGLRAGSDMRDVAMGDPQVVSGGAATPPTITLTAQPYTRTTTCTGSKTVTGTATDVTSVAWASSPSGDSGACTGTESWSCAVAVSPDATGEGVETITITATGAGGTDADTVDIGFYVAGSHSCFLAQSVDGSYNSTLSDNDAVATWENIGSSALDVTQGTGASQPTFKTSIVGGQPVVRFDGGDLVAAAAAADWDFLKNLSDSTMAVVSFKTTSAGSFQASAATMALSSSTAGKALAYNDSTVANGYRIYQDTGASGVSLCTSAAAAAPAGVFSSFLALSDSDGSTGDDLFGYINGSLACSTTEQAANVAVSTCPLTLGAACGPTFSLTGDIFRVSIYQSALTSTQRDINQAVDEWALGGTFPVTP